VTDDGFRMDVTGLYGTGRAVSGRSTDGGAAARRLLSTLDSAKGGHPAVANALSAYVTEHLLDHATKLAGEVETAGGNVSNVAATVRDGDNAAGGALSALIGTVSGLGERINRKLP